MKPPALAAGVIALSAAYYVLIPASPVPITLQTLVVCLVGGLFGPSLGAMTVLVWLGLGAVGAPVLANGASGLAPFRGATAGYLFAFPFAAALLGLLCRRGWGARFGIALGAMLLGHVVCLAGGGAWLATKIGVGAAVHGGIVPFLPGAFIKSAAGALVLRLALSARRGGGARRRRLP